MLNLPNILSLLRVAFVPVLALAIYLPFHGNNWLATGIFFLISITDWLDGCLARRLNQTTKFGAFIDPVADKICVAVVLVLVVAQNTQPWLALPIALIIARELIVSGLREWMAGLGQRAVVAVGWVGKWKTGIQFSAIGCLLFREPLGFFPTYEVGVVLLLLAAALAIWSMMQYLFAAWPILRDST